MSGNLSRIRCQITSGSSTTINFGVWRSNGINAHKLKIVGQFDMKHFFLGGGAFGCSWPAVAIVGM